MVAKYQRTPINGGVRVRIGLRALSSCIWVNFNLKSFNFHKKGFLNEINTYCCRALAMLHVSTPVRWSNKSR